MGASNNNTNNKNPRHLLARRFVLPCAVIVGAWLIFERDQGFVAVLRPLGLFFALAIPGFWLLDRAQARAHSDDSSAH